MSEPEQRIRLRSSARTNTGRVRDNNEDSVHLWGYQDRIVLAIVADGMGGAVAGEEASRIAVKTIQKGLADTDFDQIDTDMLLRQGEMIEKLRVVINEANNNIVDQADARPELKGMGTTVTLALVRDDDVIIGHVGDSRAYHIDAGDNQITQVTSDHSFVQALITAGHISEEEAEDHPMKNVLYRALGQVHDIEIDVYYEKLQIGDRLVLCSDGLTLHLKPEEIAEIALNEEDPASASSRLIEMANLRGGRDNISVIVIKAEVNPDAQPPSSNEDAKVARPAYTDEDADTLILPSQFNKQPSRTPQIENQDEIDTPSPDEPDAPKQPDTVDSDPERDEASSTLESLGEGRDSFAPDQ